jgi:PAS domain S-box-containing protein
MLSIADSRKNFFTIPSLILVTLIVAGFYFADHLKRVGLKYLRDQSEVSVKSMIAGIENEMHAANAAAKSMAGSPWILPLCLDSNKVNLDRAHQVLDRYGSSFGFSVAYLLNREGVVTASSNRGEPDSFMGENYAFRPYFQEALKGHPSFYMATGVTSKERGFYAAYPVRDERQDVVGVVALKKNVDSTRNILIHYPYAFLLNPDGIIFVSGAKDLALKALWPVPPERAGLIRESRQFEGVSFEPFFPREFQNGDIVKFRQEVFMCFRKQINFMGWSVMLLAPLSSVYYFYILGWSVVALMFIVLLMTTLWAYWSLKDQELIRQNEAKYRGLFEHSRDAVMLLAPPSWKFTSGNLATLEMFGTKSEKDFIALGPWDLSPEKQPDGRASNEKAKAMIDLAAREGFCFFNWTHRRVSGEEFPASVLLTRIGTGREMILLATVRDITQENRTREELKSKIKDLESFNKIAVDRELKMLELKERIKMLEREKGSSA